MSVRKILIVLTIFLTLIQNAFCSEIKGKKLSDTLYNYLAGEQLEKLSKSNIAVTGQDEFAYNIIIDFSADTEEIVTRDVSKRQKMILCFTQEDAYERLEEFKDFIKYLNKSNNKCVDVQILLSALDMEVVYNRGLSGSEVFAKEIDDTDSTFAICLSFEDSQTGMILTGNENHVTPLWLTKQMTDAFIASRQDFKISHPLTSLYRLNILKGDKRMGHFINANIHAIAIVLMNRDVKSGFDLLKTLVGRIDVSESDEWDTHYMFLQLKRPFKPIWINERIFLLLCISVVSLSLLLLCGFSFVGKSGNRHKKDFIRTLYMIPFTIVFSALTMILGQVIISNLNFLKSLSPIYQFSIKIIFSTAAISIMFAVQEKLRLPIASFVYGYIISIIATINIFIFSSIDILFFILFGIEYLIIYIARNVKSVPFLIFWSIIMAIPFAPYIYTVIRQADESMLSKIVFCGTRNNIVMEFAIFPFQIIWQRILVRINIYAGLNGYSSMRAILNGILAILIMAAICLFGVFELKKHIYIKNIDTSPQFELRSKEQNKELSFNVLENQFLGMNTNHINITSKHDAVKYAVRIKGDGKFPIYESTYDYSLTGENEVTFTIPNHPPKKITIDYATDSELKSDIIVEATYQTGDQIFIVETIEERIGEKK